MSEGSPGREEPFDIVVVGGGGAGLMAALAAARLGRRVLLLEKNPELGGTTRLSVGTICTTATAEQQALGILDTPDGHFEDMAKFAGDLVARDNPALRRLLVDEVPETYRQLKEAGIVFMGPIPEPPHRHPRLHAILPHSRGYVHHLAKACRRAGAELRTGCRVARLLQDGGRVGGVEATREGGAVLTIRARQAVILAAGDFSSADRGFKARFLAPELLDVEGANPTSTGDGQRLGEAAGGEVVNGDLVWGPEIRFLAPPQPALVNRLPPWRTAARAIGLAMAVLPEKLLRPFLMSFATTLLAPSPGLFAAGAILVNKAGRRFCDERDRPQDRISREADGVSYLVLDAAIAEKFAAWPGYVSTAPGVGYAYLKDYLRSRRDITFQAETVEGLAAAMGVDAAALARTLADYNASPERGARPALTRPPYFALGPAKSWIMFGEGGLRVDARLRVLDAERQPIAGLYAAGSCGQGGLILNGHGHHLGWAFTSGRLAGQNAALGEALQGD
ncbi:MAG: FAD-dependent oxidoreductase [Geminicoccaceae bacterium]